MEKRIINIMLMNETETISLIPRNDMLSYIRCYKHFSVLILRFRSVLSSITLHEVPALAQSKQNLLLSLVFSARLFYQLVFKHLVIPTLISSLAHHHDRMYVPMF